MPRRVSLPAADDLFRPTDEKPHLTAAPEPAAPAAEPGARTASGRVKHDEKMTVYVTSSELLDLEEARLSLRRQGLSVDRGRLVRAAIAMALAELDEQGSESELVRRLSS
ncbi:hypothetical protein [uncultured Nocardioides sp.]|uniref:hypothetical protein n=1 Tax=uncultured Nocardioides sp. TaxID=198441 RepID=UPI0026037CE5|nr:hypothetical protein [uncultured Nocardioides sp.]